MALVAGHRLLEGKGDKTDHARILQAQLPQLLREQSSCVAPSGSFSVDVRFRHRKAGAVYFEQEAVRGRCRLHRLSNAKRRLDRLQLAERFYRQQAQQAGRLRDDGFWIASRSVALVPEDGSRVL